MPSNTKITKAKRKNKHRPNRENLKKYWARIKKNAEILRMLDSQEK